MALPQGNPMNARGGGLEPPTSRIRILRAASCATPEWANRQFSPPRPARRRRLRPGPGGGTRILPRARPASLRSGPMTLERVVIVGGGVIGTMHAWEACRRGWEVVHLEADPGPRRASVRMFGLVWVSGRAPGPELDLALRARELWEEIAGQAPDVGFRPDGSLTIA